MCAKVCHTIKLPMAGLIMQLRHRNAVQLCDKLSQSWMRRLYPVRFTLIKRESADMAEKHSVEISSMKCLSVIWETPQQRPSERATSFHWSMTKWWKQIMYSKYSFRKETGHLYIRYQQKDLTDCHAVLFESFITSYTGDGITSLNREYQSLNLKV